jgi:hydroxyethylthiazole kinase-like uncharacterized protein yjeF
MKVSRVEEMREMDRSAVEKYGILEHLLMENAGIAAYSVLEHELGVCGKRFLILCGSGNNGGDGIVVARKIYSGGGEPRIWLLGEEAKFKGAAKLNLDIAHRLSLPIKRVESVRELAREIQACDAVIDAIFGTGITRDVEGIYRDTVELVNKSGKIVFSIDIPSGINGNSGRVMSAAVRANFTITFGLPKIGNMLYPGFDCGGKLYVSHISFPPTLYDRKDLKIEINIPPPLPERDESGHKGDFGDVLVISGAASYYGAPYFCALSFLRAGGGYSRLATPASVTPYIAVKGSEIVFHPQRETSTGSLSLECRNDLLELSELVDMVIIGPGLSLNEETQSLVRQLVGAISKPLLIDGDGLTAVSRDPGILKKRSSPTVLTPHLGEMARITGRAVQEIDNNRIDVVQEWAKRLSSVIVLKGAHSLVGYSDGRIFINLTGDSGMATAGSGDVLTGTVAAAFGLGLKIEDAARTGVFLHGFAGDLAALSVGKDGMTAQTILDYLPQALKGYREEYKKITSSYYSSVYFV